MLSFSISYWDLIKFAYFVDTTERGDRGWKQAQRQGDFTDNSNNYTKYNSEKSIDKIWVGIYFTYDWGLAQNNSSKKI
jgi:hypothetical protein